jgi:hypothetical protein
LAFRQLGGDEYARLTPLFAKLVTLAGITFALPLIRVNGSDTSQQQDLLLQGNGA